MHESREDIAALQELLDRIYAAAGSHLLSIHTPERRLNAEQVAARLTGMCLPALATVTADGRPVVGPVDGIGELPRFRAGVGPNRRRANVRVRDAVSLRPGRGRRGSGPGSAARSS